MHPRGPFATLFLAMIVLTTGILVGCGAGDQSSDGSQGGGGAKKEPAQRAGNVKKKVLFGTVAFVNVKTEGFSVRPSLERQGNKPIVFKLANKSEITLGGNEATIEDMKKGQQAQVGYVVRNDRNRARSVKLFEGGNPPQGGGTEDDQGGEKTN